MTRSAGANRIKVGMPSTEGGAGTSFSLLESDPGLDVAASVGNRSLVFERVDVFRHCVL